MPLSQASRRRTRLPKMGPLCDLPFSPHGHRNPLINLCSGREAIRLRASSARSSARAKKAARCTEPLDATSFLARTGSAIHLLTIILRCSASALCQLQRARRRARWPEMGPLFDFLFSPHGHRNPFPDEHFYETAKRKDNGNCMIENENKIKVYDATPRAT